MREIRCAVELRADESRLSPGRIVGVLMRYGTRAADRAEVFAQDALSWDTERGIVLNEQHNRQAPILRFRPEVSGAEVRIDAALPDTQRGRDAATLVRDGTLTGLSVEFIPSDESWDGEVREIRAARLVGAGLVDDASYPASAVRVRQRQRRRLWL